MDWLLWAAGAATILSGFFSYNSYALRNTNRRELEGVFGRRGRRRLEGLLAHLADLQMLCALLRNLTNLVLLMVMLYVFEAAQGASLLRVALAMATTGGLLSVFGVAIPHAWARYAGAKALVGTAWLLLTLRVLLWPVVMVMRAFVTVVRRVAGADLPGLEQAGGQGGGQMPEAVKEEILQVAAEARNEGAVRQEEVKMIESVIDFAARRAGEIMTPRTDIVALPLDAAGPEVRRTVISAGHSRIPVYDGDIDRIVGILHAKDLLGLDTLQQLDLRTLIRQPFFVPASKCLDELLREFKAGRHHLAVVLDEYGGTAGLVTIEDLLEEIVGEISDEYDRVPSPLLTRLDERTVEVAGRLRISQLNDALGLRLPEGADYDTVAGLVFAELGFVPRAGETLNKSGAKFTVLAADARRITRLRVELPGGETP